MGEIWGPFAIHYKPRRALMLKDWTEKRNQLNRIGRTQEENQWLVIFGSQKRIMFKMYTFERILAV